MQPFAARWEPSEEATSRTVSELVTRVSVLAPSRRQIHLLVRMRLSPRFQSASRLALVAIVVLAACADLKELMTFMGALQAEYRMPANVNLANGGHLQITFQSLTPDLQKADSSDRASFARDVAIFTKSHYPRPARLEDVTVAFANVSSMGPVTITRSDGAYSFRMRELP